MLVFRSLTIGLLGACLYLLGNLQILTDYADIEMPVSRVIEAAPAAVGNNVTVIDVAPHVPDTQIAGLVRLRERERIVAVNEAHVGNDLAAGMQIGEVLRRGSKLLDLTVGGEGEGVRRVLVIVH